MMWLLATPLLQHCNIVMAFTCTHTHSHGHASSCGIPALHTSTVKHSSVTQHRTRSTRAFQPSQRLRKRRSLQSSFDASNESSDQPDFREADSGLYLPTDNDDADDVCMSIDPDAISSGGVAYQKVIDGMDQLLPEEGIEERNALSRKEGYWPFIRDGKDPPQGLVYGEFDLHFFAQLLDRACDSGSWQGKNFYDLGSGIGRLVLTAGALHAWDKCCGIELLESLHEGALDNLRRCEQPSGSDEADASGHAQIKYDLTSSSSDLDANSLSATEPQPQVSSAEQEYWKQYSESVSNQDFCLQDLASNFGDPAQSSVTQQPDSLQIPSSSSSSSSSSSPQQQTQTQPQTHSQQPQEEADAPTGQYALPSGLPLAPVHLTCGSFDDPYEYFGDADCIFVFSSAMPTDLMVTLSNAIGRQCKPGCVVITTEHPLVLQGTVPPYANIASGPYRLELVEELTGQNGSTGGRSTAYVHRVVESLWLGEGVRPQRPVPTLEDTAFDVAKQHMDGTLGDAERFARNVRNNMVHNGIMWGQDREQQDPW